MKVLDEVCVSMGTCLRSGPTEKPYLCSLNSFVSPVFSSSAAPEAIRRADLVPFDLLWRLCIRHPPYTSDSTTHGHWHVTQEPTTRYCSPDNATRQPFYSKHRTSIGRSAPRNTSVQKLDCIWLRIHHQLGPSMSYVRPGHSSGQAIMCKVC